MSEPKTEAKVISKRIDVKAVTLNAFGTSLELAEKGGIEGVSISPDTRMFIITNFGIISGELEVMLSTSEPVTAFNQAIFRARDSLLASLEQELGNEAQVVNNSGVVTLANARLTVFSNPNATFSFQRISLFTDQIVGFSYGQFSDAPQDVR